MKYLKTFLVSIFIAQAINAQVTECTTLELSDTIKQSLPWFGNNQILFSIQVISPIQIYTQTLILE